MSRPSVTFHTGPLPDAAREFKKFEISDIEGMPSEHAQVASWEALVKTVYAVFQMPDGKQHVMFITTDNKLAKEELYVCMQCFPDKMFAFLSQPITAIQN